MGWAKLNSSFLNFFLLNINSIKEVEYFTRIKKNINNKFSYLNLLICVLLKFE